jgi:tetratricopeptide (TPR) repeat protein
MIRVLKTFCAMMMAVMSVDVFGQSNEPPLELILTDAKELVDQKKYASAFNLLEQHDPNNESVDAVLLKEEISIKYFVTSLGHQMFSFLDIQPDEDIMDYRGAEGTASLHVFPVNDILDSLILVYPDDCRLHKGLGDYYYDVHLRYGSNWIMEEEVVFSRIKAGYEKVVNGPCEDYMTSYALGYIALIHDNLEECIPLFKHSIELDASYPTSHYNLAYAYLFKEDPASALPHAVNSMNLYNDVTYKADAARLAGQICFEMDRIDEALNYFNQSDSIEPENYYTLSSIIGIYLKTGDSRSREKAEQLFRIGPDDLDMFQMLEQVYFDYNKYEELEDIYKKMLKEYKDDDMVCGTIYFMQAAHFIETDSKKVVDFCKKSRERFVKVLPSDHPAIMTIDETIREFSEK